MRQRLYVKEVKEFLTRHYQWCGKGLTKLLAVPNTVGVRKSLRTADRATAIQRSCFGVCHLLSSVLAVERNGRRFLLSGVLMQNPEMFGNP